VGQRAGELFLEEATIVRAGQAVAHGGVVEPLLHLTLELILNAELEDRDRTELNSIAVFESGGRHRPAVDERAIGGTEILHHDGAVLVLDDLGVSTGHAVVLQREVAFRAPSDHQGRGVQSVHQPYFTSG
jgi:hypothetical protein